MHTTLYIGDALALLPKIRGLHIDAVVTDPPYGISLLTNNRARRRDALAMANDYAPIAGDDAPFDPTPWLTFPTVVLFGANHFAHRLPPSPAWIVWDKLDGLTSSREFGFNDNSDAELTWTNRNAPLRIIRHRWMGIMKASEHGPRLHPTQKPVALLRAILRQCTKPNDTVLDPYMGAGSTGVAAIQTNRRFVGVEIDARYFAIAKRRIDAAVAQQALDL